MATDERPPGEELALMLRIDAGVAGRCFSRREIATHSGELVASAAWEISAS